MQTMLVPSVALRLRLSEGNSAAWLILAPEETERAVALELQREILAQGGMASVWPGQALGTSVIALLVVTGDALDIMPARLDELRSQLTKDGGVLAFVVPEAHGGKFLHDAPHIASFVADRVVSTSAEDDVAPPEYIDRRLASLRETYGMTDEQAREAFESGRFADDIYFLEWMVLLGGASKDGRGT
jgi:hypothetical protein